MDDEGLKVFGDDLIQKVWEKALEVEGRDPGLYRKDFLGAWILRRHYGNKDSEYGWVIDEINEVKSSETIDISNLRPLQWENKSLKREKEFLGQVTSLLASNLRVK